MKQPPDHIYQAFILNPNKHRSQLIASVMSCLNGQLVNQNTWHELMFYAGVGGASGGTGFDLHILMDLLYTGVTSDIVYLFA